MARHKRSSRFESRASRLKLAIRKKPYFIAIAPNIGLGYRRNQGPGSWIARGATGSGGYWIKVFAIADDNEDANGTTVLTFWQAQDRARAIIRGSGERPATVKEALDHYAADLKARTGETSNADRVRRCLPASLAARPVTLVGARELRHWRDALVAKGQKPSSADRTARMLKAALNLAARDDPRITNTSAWKTGLARLPEQEASINKIIPDSTVRDIVAAAHAIDFGFGLLVETAAVTGARASQLLRLKVGDLVDADLPTSKLIMPSSRKGRRRRISRSPIPIPSALALKLRRHATDRTAEEPLLCKTNGRPRVKRDYVHLFNRLRSALKLADNVTLGWLRHSSIVRQLLAGVPVRVVAAGHDTSVVMLEHTYSRHIGTVSDAVVRRSLIDVTGGDA